MSTLAQYRAQVPEHATVDDPVVQRWLDLAVRAHDRDAFGTVYDDAMIAWAAHQIYYDPGAPEVGETSAASVGPIKSLRTKDQAVTYATPSGSGGAGLSPQAQDLRTTRYGQLYLQLRNSRAATAPGVAFLL